MGTATAFVVGSPSYPTWRAMVSLFMCGLLPPCPAGRRSWSRSAHVETWRMEFDISFNGGRQASGLNRVANPRELIDHRGCKVFRGECGSKCKPHDGTKAIRGGKPHEIEPRDRRFHRRGKHRRSLCRAQLRKNFRAQELQSWQFNSIARTGNNVVRQNFARTPILRPNCETNLASLDGCRLRPEPEMERELPFHFIARKPVARWTKSSTNRLDAQTLWQVMKEIGIVREKTGAHPGSKP